MFRRSFERILNKCKEKTVVLVGAGKVGREILTELLNNEIHVHEVFDNAFRPNQANLYGVPITQPHVVKMYNCLYIVCAAREDLRQEMCNQLNQIGISGDEIVCYYPNRSREYHRSIPPEEYQEELSVLFFECFKRELDWENPLTYSEIINIEKLKVDDPRRTEYADKSLVRKWISDTIGEKYLVKQYGVWEDAREINFDELPSRYVLKTNNGSVRNIIVNDASKLNQEQAIKELNQYLNDNFAYQSFEMHYKDIPPRIICEEYLEGVAESVYEYDIFCFHGEPKYIWCIKSSHKPDCRASFYDLDWKQQPFSYGYPYDEIVAPRPEGLDEMLQLSKILSKEFKHVRVDWYNMPDGRVLFGEMTFSTWGGIMHFAPNKYDRHFGNLILQGKSGSAVYGDRHES